jgi:hypothetical protein
MAVYDSSWTLKNHARPWRATPRQAIQAEKRQVVLKADRINFDLALDP